ncbi:MAG: hypothetical protein COB67_10765 [SAR324 cluster bacterium]|uniref:Metallo-beta-lactamase domain-containing protein n=1 Tax=SAR324 cluster bacterium TaxID=2024889 RepID=A0A2A4SW07_9DELT|nr:MAG: hypothetical protein COB67_10765 [SAR324 cluster bacterium]
MEPAPALITEYQITEGATLYSSSLGNILIGCPPEILKKLLSRHAPMPDTVVIPGTLQKFSSSQACLEFPFYHFLFIQQGLARGKKFKVFAQKDVCEKLADMLRVTLLGPDWDEVLQVEQRLGIPQRLNLKKVKQILAEVRFLALKAQDGHSYLCDELVTFIPLAIGETQVVYPAFEKHPEVQLSRTGLDQFTLRCNRELTYQQEISSAQVPSYEIKGIQVESLERESQKIFTLRCLGASEGFDASQPANGYLLRFQGKWFLWDCPAFLRSHLHAVGLEFSDLEGIFISHVHEDHLDIMQTLEPGHQVPIYTSPEIFHCMLLKLSANLNCDYDQARAYYDFHPIYADEPFELFGAQIEVFYSCHAIPALGLNLRVPNSEGESRLFISGDHLAQRVIQQLAKAGVYSPERLQELETRLPPTEKYNLILVDSGAGMIHGDPTDYFKNPNQVLYMHTGKPIQNIPEHHGILKSGQCYLIHPG